jgi:beta-glucosidase
MTKMNKYCILLASCIIALLSACTPSPEKRAADLLNQLTLEEKAFLMLNNSPEIERLGIKQYNWWNEALHGVARNGSATVFPQPIGMASSFDTDKIEQVFTAVSDEARIKHAEAAANGEIGQYQGLSFWTPNINIFRDPRWGRGMETYGEDPYLTGQLGMAVVRGLQGDPEASVLKTHACAKHYAVHSGLESNRHSFDAEISERDLRETYLPAFKDLVTKAGVKEVMTAYNRFRGVPCAASEYLVKDILRGEWGFKGLVVSDCWAIPDFFEEGRHGYVDNEVMAAAVAVKNGLDVECGTSFARIPEAVQEGLLDEKDLDRNLLRVLTERFRLGEMDGSSPWDNLDPSLVEGPVHRALSLEMAHESMVLLKNNGILPLKAEDKIALIGPNADDAEMLWGNYNPVPEHTVTLRQAMQERIPGLIYFPACGIIDAQYMPAPDPRMAAFLQMSDEQLAEIAKRYAIGVEDIKSYQRRDEQMKQSFLPALDETAVLEQLEGIDIVVFAGGISPRLEGEEMPVEVPGFSGGDRTDIELPDVQRRLLRILHEAGKKVVFVNFSGAAIGLVPETETCDAILQAWYPGQEGGTAVTDVLLGDVAPSGKLPVTFYKDAGQLPQVENYDVEGHTYRYFRGEPLYPFGYGLSYTTFTYGQPKVKGKKLEVTVTNTGSVDGTEVVQLYVRRPEDSLGPVKTLRGFQRVTIPAGESIKVSFPLTDETFLWWSEDKQDMIPLHGDYQLLVGGSSADKDLQAIAHRF